MLCKEKYSKKYFCLVNGNEYYEDYMPDVVMRENSSDIVQNWVHGYLSHIRRYHAPLYVIWSSTNGYSI